MCVCFTKLFENFQKKVNATSTWRQAGTRFSCTSGPSELRVLMGVLTTHAQSVNGGPRYTYTPVPPTSVSCLSCYLGTHAKISNPTSIPSGVKAMRVTTRKEEKKRKGKIPKIVAYLSCSAKPLVACNTLGPITKSSCFPKLLS